MASVQHFKRRLYITTFLWFTHKHYLCNYIFLRKREETQEE